MRRPNLLSIIFMCNGVITPKVSEHDQEIPQYQDLLKSIKHIIKPIIRKKKIQRLSQFFFLMWKGIQTEAPLHIKNWDKAEFTNTVKPV